MSLSLKLPDESETYQLLRQDGGAVENNYQVTLTDITFLKMTDNSNQILRAKMSGEDVVVKFTYEEQVAIPRLKQESQIYVDYLKPLWGIHVPKFYGLYLYNPLDPDKLSCACIILQYCGEPAVSDLSQLKDYRSDEYGIKRFRNDTLDIVFRLHSPEIGLEHDALNASHILDFQGKPFLIDFSGAELHDCFAWEEGKQLTRDVLPAKEGEILQQMGSQSVECYELWNLLESLDYCIPRAIKLYGTTVACKNINSAADLYKRALRKWPKVRSEEEMWNVSVKHWRRIHFNWKKYHPEAVIEPPLGIVDLQEYLDLETDC
ncbi:hypothetical protein E4T56_gene10755 [Termitomyces sp. T112]|nr:hypothetical protein E4T56_gene10755 [Termitomyces sp. T112]